MQQIVLDEDQRYHNLFLDTEFHEDGKTIDLISIALVDREDEFYRCSTDAELHRVNPWVRANVLPHLPRHDDQRWQPRTVIAGNLKNFVRNRCGNKKPRFWAYYADYDWVALCQLFGTMMNLPEGFPMYCMDLKQYAVMLDAPPLPKPIGQHDALADARWNMAFYDHLMLRP